MANFKMKHYLDRHDISQKQRSKMIDWVIEVLDIFNQSDRTVFRSIFILELFMKRCKRVLNVKDLHLIGVVSMFIASKLEEVKVIKLKSIIVDICKYKFSKEEILNTEKKILIALNFSLNAGTLFEYFTSMVSLMDLPLKVSEPIKKYAVLLQKMFLYSYDIQNVYVYQDIATYSIIISMKLYGHTNKFFNSSKYIQKALKLSCIEKNQILDNLNFLRDFASNFHKKFSFNNLQINSNS